MRSFCFPSRGSIRLPKIQEHLPKVNAKLSAAFPVAQPVSDPATLELFGGAPTQPTQDVSYALAAEIVKPEHADKVRELVVAVIDTESELRKELNNAGYLLKQVTDAHTRLRAAVSDGLRPDSTTAGVRQQVESIDILLNKIRDWLTSKNA